jgi:hypothetical protein
VPDISAIHPVQRGQRGTAHIGLPGVSPLAIHRRPSGANDVWPPKSRGTPGGLGRHPRGCPNSQGAYYCTFICGFSALCLNPLFDNVSVCPIGPLCLMGPMGHTETLSVGKRGRASFRCSSPIQLPTPFLLPSLFSLLCFLCFPQSFPPGPPLPCSFVFLFASLRVERRRPASSAFFVSSKDFIYRATRMSEVPSDELST